MNQEQHGFTLIELMVAIAVLAILVTTAVPAFGDLVRDSRMRTSVNELVTTFRVARGEALKRGKTVSLCASDDLVTCAEGGRRGFLVFTDADGNYQLGAGDEVLHVHEWSANAPALYTSTDKLQFRATGRATAAPNFEFCDARGSEAARTVMVSRTGRVSGVGHLGSETCL